MSTTRERTSVPEDGVAAGPTHTEQAVRAFLDGLRQIPGVVRAITHGGERAEERTVLVYVPELRTPVSEAVFKLEGDVRRAFAAATLRVEVDGVAESGLRSEDLDRELPAGAQIEI